jgi:hypothetical protein
MAATGIASRASRDAFGETAIYMQGGIDGQHRAVEGRLIAAFNPARIVPATHLLPRTARNTCGNGRTEREVRRVATGNKRGGATRVTGSKRHV